MRNYSIYCVLFLMMTSTCLKAQVQRDQDLVTLKNGYQLLGYVIEQRPGKLIKVYRPVENDTVEVALTDVAKLTKIWVQPFSEKKMEARDSIIPGRFNNKKNVFTVTYVWQVLDIEQKARRGLGFSWNRSISRNYQAGLGTIVFGRQNPMPQRSEWFTSFVNHSFMQVHVLFSNQIRLGKKVQNHRFSTLLSVNPGWVIDRTKTTFNSGDGDLKLGYEQSRGGFTFQTGIVFRINPDNQSGFALEPGYSFYGHQVKQFASEPGTAGSTYLGFRREMNHLFTLKLSYFF